MNTRRYGKGSRLMLPGAHRVVIRKSGRVRIYWRSGRERGAVTFGNFAGDTLAEAEALELAAAGDIARRYAELVRPSTAPGYVAKLIEEYIASPDFNRLAVTTKRVWRGHLDGIKDVFGPITLEGIQKEGSRAAIYEWRDTMADKPRTANIRLTVLARVFSWGVDHEKLKRNPAQGIGRLDEGPGRADIIWYDDELARLVTACPAPVARAVRLAALTGLRKADVVGLTWSEVDFARGVIDRATLKSNRRQRAVIPLLPATRALLDECPRLGPLVLTNAHGRPWRTADSFDSSFRPALDACGVDKHFHDLRGTAATRFFAAGLSVSEVARIMGWREAEAERIAERYTDRRAVVEGIAARLQQRGA
jgi:integrase